MNLLIGFLLLSISSRVHSFYQFSPSNPLGHASSQTQLFSTIWQKLNNVRNQILKPKVEVKTENELLVEYIDYKPWRGPKKKNLKVCYRNYEETWLERFRNASDDTIYQYTVRLGRWDSDLKRRDLACLFPWSWSNPKIDRLAWLTKVYENDLESMSVQEFIELDALYAEVDLPIRWAMVRMPETWDLHWFFAGLAYYTDLNGIRPTDLGLRPDHTLKVCPVQDHNCFSSMNDVNDPEHYFPSLVYSRDKSPEQAFDEIKSIIYDEYPKGGLKWTNGWIDRGGWFPQTYSDKSYFYITADSWYFGYTDDIELLIDYPHHKVDVRMASRVGFSDLDAKKLRYNQFVRMLLPKTGWEIDFLPKSHWELLTPYRWTELLMKRSAYEAEHLADRVIKTVQQTTPVPTAIPATPAADADAEGGLTRALLQSMYATLDEQVIQPFLSLPIVQTMEHDMVEKIHASEEMILHNPWIEQVTESVQAVKDDVIQSLQELKDERAMQVLNLNMEDPGNYPWQGKDYDPKRWRFNIQEKIKEISEQWQQEALIKQQQQQEPKLFSPAPKQIQTVDRETMKKLLQQSSSSTPAATDASIDSTAASTLQYQQQPQPQQSLDVSSSSRSSRVQQQSSTAVSLARGSRATSSIAPSRTSAAASSFKSTDQLLADFDQYKLQQKQQSSLRKEYRINGRVPEQQQTAAMKRQQQREGRQQQQAVKEKEDHRTEYEQIAAAGHKYKRSLGIKVDVSAWS